MESSTYGCELHIEIVSRTEYDLSDQESLNL